MRWEDRVETAVLANISMSIAIVLGVCFLNCEAGKNRVAVQELLHRARIERLEQLETFKEEVLK